MLFPIDAFKTLVGTFSRSNRFEISIPGLNIQQQLLCNSAQFPGIGITYEEIYRDGPQARKIANGLMNEDIQLGFLLDGNYGSRRFFENWKDRVVKTENGTKRLGFYKDYVQDVEIYQLDGFHTRTNGALLKDCYPTILSPIDFSSDAENTIATFSVTLHFHEYEMIGGTFPFPVTFPFTR